MSDTERGQRRPTLDQVAALAGFSPKTVSRVINRERYVSPATADRVLAAAAELGFRPNGMAREFQAGARSRTIGFITGDVANPFYARLAKGAESVLKRHGYQLMTASTDEEPSRERELILDMVDRRVGGLLLVSADIDHGALGRERANGTPVVFLDRPPIGVDGDAVVIDNQRGIAAAVEHLVTLGHERIGLIGDLSRLSTHRERIAAFEASMRTAGRSDWQQWVRTNSHDASRAEAAAHDLMTLPTPPTALITTNNRITIGALRAIRGLPQPPALIGFDDFELADLLGVSVIAYDSEQMGALAAERLLQRITGNGPPMFTTDVVVTRLIERGTTLRQRPPSKIPTHEANA